MATKWRAKPVVLLIDDQPFFQVWTTDALEGIYEVVARAESTSALKLLKERTVSAILLDVQLETENGLDLVELIRALSRAPIIIVTGHSTEQTVMTALSLHVDGYLKKPFTPDELRSVLFKVAPTSPVIHARSHIERFYHQDMSAADIAEHVGLSNGHLRAEFMKEHGKSPMGFLTQIRMERALEYLSKERYSIHQVAMKVGIPNPDRFRRVFTRYYGFPPSQIKPVSMRSPVEQREDGIACVKFEKPIPVAACRNNQLELAIKGRIVRCNDVYARMYGSDHSADLIGLPFGDVVSFANQNAVDRFYQFVQAGYLYDEVVEDHVIPRDPGPALINVSGVIRDGLLLEMWGSRSALPKPTKTDKNDA